MSRVFTIFDLILELISKLISKLILVDLVNTLPMRHGHAIDKWGIKIAFDRKQILMKIETCISDNSMINSYHSRAHLQITTCLFSNNYCLSFELDPIFVLSNSSCPLKF